MLNTLNSMKIWYIFSPSRDDLPKCRAEQNKILKPLDTWRAPIVAIFHQYHPISYGMVGKMRKGLVANVTSQLRVLGGVSLHKTYLPGQDTL